MSNHPQIKRPDNRYTILRSLLTIYDWSRGTGSLHGPLPYLAETVATIGDYLMLTAVEHVGEVLFDAEEAKALDDLMERTPKRFLEHNDDEVQLQHPDFASFSRQVSACLDVMFAPGRGFPGWDEADPIGWFAVPNSWNRKSSETAGPPLPLAWPPVPYSRKQVRHEIARPDKRFLLSEQCYLLFHWTTDWMREIDPEPYSQGIMGTVRELSGLDARSLLGVCLLDELEVEVLERLCSLAEGLAEIDTPNVVGEPAFQSLSDQAQVCLKWIFATGKGLPGWSPGDGRLAFSGGAGRPWEE